MEYGTPLSLIQSSNIIQLWQDQYEDVRAHAWHERRRFRAWIHHMGLEHHEDGFIFMVINPHRYMLACVKYGFQHITTP